MNPAVDNPNLHQAALIVDALVAGGVREICLAPGSRSTPLALACAAHPGLSVTVHLDERSAGFFALGLARAAHRPVALLCTSGTAAVNFHPAVVEAFMSAIPLVLLTADRPPELRHSGANQTIDQVGLFGSHVRAAFDLPLPEPTPPAVARRNVAGLVTRALDAAQGPPAGPVHLNCPFRKPLEPADEAGRDALRRAVAARSGLPGGVAPPRIQRGAIRATDDQLEDLAAAIDDHPRGLIVCGPGCPGGDFPAAVAALARRAGYPIAADPLSGLRHGPHVTGTPLWTGYETALAGGRPPAWAPPTLVLRFGAVPTSRWLNAWLDGLDNPLRIHVRAAGIWADDSHRTGRFLQAEEAHLCRALPSRISRRPDAAWNDAVATAEAALWSRLRHGLADGWWDAGALSAVMAALPPRTRVTVGNSLPIRHVDQFIPPAATPLTLTGNRGASGIDGVVSTALGSGFGSANPVALLIGDISFYHDMNGLLALRYLPDTAVTIFLFNNDGGAIFGRLPIAAVEPPFRELFTTPHGLDFAHTAALYGLDYRRVADRAGLAAALARPWTPGHHRLVEIRSDASVDEARRRALVRAAQEAAAP